MLCAGLKFKLQQKISPSSLQLVSIVSITISGLTGLSLSLCIGVLATMVQLQHFGTAHGNNKQKVYSYCWGKGGQQQKSSSVEANEPSIDSWRKLLSKMAESSATITLIFPVSKQSRGYYTMAKGIFHDAFVQTTTEVGLESFVCGSRTINGIFSSMWTQDGLMGLVETASI